MVFLVLKLKIRLILIIMRIKILFSKMLDFIPILLKVVVLLVYGVSKIWALVREHFRIFIFITIQYNFKTKE